MSLSPPPDSPQNDEVLPVVIAVVKETLARPAVEIRPETNLIELIRQYGFLDSLDDVEMLMEIEDRLGVTISLQEFAAFTWPDEYRKRGNEEAWEQEVVPKLTVGALADFVRERCKPISFEPLSLMGSPPSPAAGYFVGMTEIVRQIQPKPQRFGPSTPITKVLPPRDLGRFWQRLSRSTNHWLPPLKFWVNHLSNLLLIGSALCLCFGVFVNWAFLAGIWLTLLKVAQVAWWLRNRANPLPKGIDTFGDLSRYLASQQRAAAATSIPHSDTNEPRP